jgi:glycosyltransferase involved in cell wall biosynthesis
MATISIIIPAYNAERTLEETLDSITQQTYRDYEVIVVDDGSTDRTAEIVLTHSLQPTLIQQTNAGAAVARNTGADGAQGDYFLFCDADIVLQPNALQKMFVTLDEHPEAAYAYSGFRYGWKTFPMLTFDPYRLRQIPYIHTTSLIRAKHFPGFDPALKRFQDWDLWLTMLERGDIGVGIPEVLFSVKPGGTMSRWVPKALLELPLFKTLPAVRSYHHAKIIIDKKHHLTERNNPLLS